MNIRDIETLVDLVHVSRVSELTVQSDTRRVTIRKDPGAGPPKKSPIDVVGTGAPAPISEPKPASAPAASFEVVTSPMVGVFHTAVPPLGIGASVNPGQVIGSIESMRLMNDVLAEVSGVVGAIMLEDGMAVEYGQPILRVDLDSTPEETKNGA